MSKNSSIIKKYRPSIGQIKKGFAQACLVSATLLVTSCGSSDSYTQFSSDDNRTKSVARLWNQVILEGIRNDFARPTVHARNLFHMSSAMYDAWAAYSTQSSTFLLGKSTPAHDCSAQVITRVADTQLAREEAVSFAAYRLINHRFKDSPDSAETLALANELMQQLGYDANDSSQDLTTGSAAALGNFIANCYMEYGFNDGSNELNDYANIAYSPVNPPLMPHNPGNSNMTDLNRWQPLALATFIDQSGNVTSSTPDFLSPEWGAVTPFALSAQDASSFDRDNYQYKVYFDPGMPPLAAGDSAAEFKWGFSLVSVWSSHLDPTDGVMIDISPASLGNISDFPTEFSNYNSFYNYLEGGDSSQGYTQNPKTGQAYQQQMVPRGDYARVLAEFWADGPDSETPPGHWFVILNTVNDHPEFEKKFKGQGDELGSLEWDVKAYFALAGAMHDSAIAAWGIKGWYDYLRPISAIRSMAHYGQSSDPNQASYDSRGITLEAGKIELVAAGDPLAGNNNEHVGKIKLKAWKGPDYIIDTSSDVAGVDWILAENWWPYQRPSFVTPPFAGYVSGHSTYSRAAAELLTELTGDPFFPGGMSGFTIEADNFLVFEKGPSVDMTLQWATYRDASDQCSLSRIWGGIHPPADDIPGRLIGEKIGLAAFDYAEDYFLGRR